MNTYTYYTCEPTWEAMLSCIYEAWASGKGHQNVRLLLEPVQQYTLFDEYVHVDADEKKFLSVMDAVNRKISPDFYRALRYSSMAYEEDVLDNIYRCMVLGFAYGPDVIERVQYEVIMRNQLLRTRLGKEVNRFQEFMRFHRIDGGANLRGSTQGDDAVYVAHFEPKSRIVEALVPIFEDRMPSEHWMIIDDIHREAIVHPKEERSYLVKLSREEFERLLETEHADDGMATLWRVFFHSIAIEQRKNEPCQRNHAPLWARKHMVEFW